MCTIAILSLNPAAVGMMPLEPCSFRQLLCCATGVCCFCPGALCVDMCRLMPGTLDCTSKIVHIHSHVGAVSTVGVATEGANYLFKGFS